MNNLLVPTNYDFIKNRINFEKRYNGMNNFGRILEKNSFLV